MNTKQKTETFAAQTYKRFDCELVRGKGAKLYDENGCEYIDFTSGIGVNAIGHGNEAFAAAIFTQAKTLAHSSNLYYNKPSAELLEKLCLSAGFQRGFLCNSGAEANECAIKAARKYSFDKYGKGRSKIVTLQNSFHGRTMATVSATGQNGFHNFFFPFLEGFDYCPANDLEALEKILNAGALCAFMFECVQGEGGVLPVDKSFLQNAAALCAEKDILLIADEVQSGIGRTGRMSCFEYYEISPDIATYAKGLGGGLPIGAALFGSKTADIFTPGTHGSTFGGNPVACAGANVVLDMVSDPAFLKEVELKGYYFRAELSKIAHIEQVRGMGLMLGAQLKSGIDAAEIAKKCTENGLLVLTAKTFLRFLPPLTITKSEIDSGIEILKNVLNTTK